MTIITMLVNENPATLSLKDENNDPVICRKGDLLELTKYTLTFKNSVTNYPTQVDKLYDWAMFSVNADMTSTPINTTVTAGDLGNDNMGKAITGFNLDPGYSIIKKTGKTAETAVQIPLLYDELRDYIPDTLFGGEIGGTVFKRGVYESNANVLLTTGSLTFDAEGNHDSVFIINVKHNFTITSQNIILLNNANVFNVFFSVQGDLIVTGASILNGTFVMNGEFNSTEASITTINGRIFGKAGGKILMNNDIVNRQAPVILDQSSLNLVRVDMTNIFSNGNIYTHGETLNKYLYLPNTNTNLSSSDSTSLKIVLSEDMTFDGKTISLQYLNNDEEFVNLDTSGVGYIYKSISLTWNCYRNTNTPLTRC